ncbi:VanZ family protein [Streptomyces sp. NPDC056144]|uniref:VanZ family protein n=1 Tax=unclassified Streptomyces TaxID=2593676 RepID=UPI0035DF38D3
MWRILFSIDTYSVTCALLALLLLSVIAYGCERLAPRLVPLPARVLCAVFTLPVLVATLAPDQPIGSGSRHLWLIPGDALFFSNIPVESMERSMYVLLQVANLLMFVPAAVAFRFAWPAYGPWGPVRMGLALSLFIEAAQWAMAAGRVVDIDDVIANTTGAALGALLCLAAGRLTRPLRRPRRRPHRRTPSHRRSRAGIP